LFHATEVLAKTSDYIDRLVKAAAVIKSNGDNIDREERFKLCTA
jgi:hypothetical protein